MNAKRAVAIRGKKDRAAVVQPDRIDRPRHGINRQGVGELLGDGVERVRRRHGDARLVRRAAHVDEVNGLFKEEANRQRYRGVLGVIEDPIVSSDVIKEPYASIIDLEMTQVVDGDLVKIMAWYDNEWGYASQMVREALRLTGQ